MSKDEIIAALREERRWLGEKARHHHERYAALEGAGSAYQATDHHAKKIAYMVAWDRLDALLQRAERGA